MTDVQYNRRAFAFLATLYAASVAYTNWRDDPSTLLAMFGAAVLVLGGIATTGLLLDRAGLGIPASLVGRIPRLDTRMRLACLGISWAGLVVLIAGQGMPDPYRIPVVWAGVAMSLAVGSLSMVWPRREDSRAA